MSSENYQKKTEDFAIAMRSSKTQHKILAPVIKASHSGACKANHCSTLKDYNEQRKDIDREAFVGAEGLEGNAHTIDMPSIAEDWSSFTHHRSSRVESRISFAMINLRLSEQQANIKYRHLADDHLCSLAFIVLSLIIMIMLGNFSVNVEAVDCFKCSSRNGSNPACEDPFHNVNSTKVITPILPEMSHSVIYHAPCFAGKKGRDGLFPASACIKLVGTFDNTGETLVVRHCALDSGTLTQDTELARMSHCGKFQFEGDLLQGCVLACPEDACNAALKGAAPSRFFIVLSALALIMSAANFAPITRNHLRQ